MDQWAPCFSAIFIYIFLCLFNSFNIYIYIYIYIYIKYRLRSNLMFLIGSDMNVVLPANKDQENKHVGETKQLLRRIEWLSLIRVVIDSSIHYPIPGPSY